MDFAGDNYREIPVKSSFVLMLENIILSESKVVMMSSGIFKTFKLLKKPVTLSLSLSIDFLIWAMHLLE